MYCSVNMTIFFPLELFRQAEHSNGGTWVGIQEQFSCLLYLFLANWLANFNSIKVYAHYGNFEEDTMNITTCGFMLIFDRRRHSFEAIELHMLKIPIMIILTTEGFVHYFPTYYCFNQNLLIQTQNFPFSYPCRRRRHPPPPPCQHMILPEFPKTCIKLKKMGLGALLP